MLINLAYGKKSYQLQIGNSPSDPGYQLVLRPHYIKAIRGILIGPSPSLYQYYALFLKKEQ